MLWVHGEPWDLSTVVVVAGTALAVVATGPAQLILGRLLQVTEVRKRAPRLLSCAQSARVYVPLRRTTGRSGVRRHLHRAAVRRSVRFARRGVFRIHRM